jgi:hypothetical protein
VKTPVAIVASVAILCVTALELYALHLGYDGVMLTSTVAGIIGFAGLACGFTVARRK